MNRIDHTGESSFDELPNTSEFVESFRIFEKSPSLPTHFDATSLRSAKARGSRLRVAAYIQNMDNAAAAMTLFRRATDDEPTPQSMKINPGLSINQGQRENDRGETALTGERNTTNSTNAHSQQQDPERPEQSHKRKRAAEALRRLELLEEERELQDNLADFWDSRFDKPRRRRFSQASSDAHTQATLSQPTQENTIDSNESTVATKHC